MKTALDYLFRVESPWIYVGCGEPERKKWIPSYFYSHTGINTCVRRLRGKKMRTKAALMDEFGASLQFFDGFGENWDALGECLVCLDEWLLANVYILVIESAEELLQDEHSDQMVALLKTLHDAGESWAKPITDNGRFDRGAIPFHVLLNVSENEPSAVDEIARVAGEAKIPIRR